MLHSTSLRVKRPLSLMRCMKYRWTSPCRVPVGRKLISVRMSCIWRGTKSAINWCMGRVAVVTKSGVSVLQCTGGEELGLFIGACILILLQYLLFFRNIWSVYAACVTVRQLRLLHCVPPWWRLVYVQGCGLILSSYSRLLKGCWEQWVRHSWIWLNRRCLDRLLTLHISLSGEWKLQPPWAEANLQTVYSLRLWFLHHKFLLSCGVRKWQLLDSAL